MIQREIEQYSKYIKFSLFKIIKNFLRKDVELKHEYIKIWNNKMSFEKILVFCLKYFQK